MKTLTYKAESAGGWVRKVNPRHTSQRCSGCGAMPDQRLTLGDRTYVCLTCGLVVERDVNAARNVLQAGLSGLPGGTAPVCSEDGEHGPVGDGPRTQNRRLGSPSIQVYRSLPETNRGSYADGAVEGVRAAIISCGDAAPILEPAEQALNEVAALVKLRVVDNRLFTVGVAWNTGLDASLGKGLAQPVSVITLVGYQDIGFR